MNGHKIIIALGLTFIGCNLTIRWIRHLARKSYVENQILLGLYHIHHIVKDIRQHQLADVCLSSEDDDNSSENKT